MSHRFEWFESQYKSDGTATGLVGGPISESHVFGYPTGLFAAFTGTAAGSSLTGYAKVFVQCVGEDSLYNPRIYVDAAEYTDHIAIATGKAADDFMTGWSGFPEGYASDDFEQPNDYSGGLQYSTLASGDSAGVWIQITVTGAATDPQAGFSLKLEGTTTP